MSGAGSALMGIGSARGENRARNAAEEAIASPLLEASMEGAHGVLLSIYGGSDLGLFEINEAASLVAEAAHPDANIIFGAVIDDTLGDEVRITVIAAGFDSGQLPYKKVEPRRDSAISVAGATSAHAPELNGATGIDDNNAGSNAGNGWSLPTSAVGRSVVNLDEDLDIPDFLK
jgi:cell division protein FtsZ